MTGGQKTADIEPLLPKRVSTMQNKITRVSLPVPALMLVTEPMERARLIDIVCRAAAGGVNMVQVRDKTLPPEELAVTAALLKRRLPEIQVLVNSGPAAAQIGESDGIHLPEQGRTIAAARGLTGPRRLIGRSVHSAAAAQKAAAEGADYLIAGTIFASRSHPDIEPAGLEFLRAVCAAARVPVLAIGGITPENAADCLQAGAAGVAVLSAILYANDPEGAARRYRHSLNTAQNLSADERR